MGLTVNFSLLYGYDLLIHLVGYLSTEVQNKPTLSELEYLNGDGKIPYLGQG